MANDKPQISKKEVPGHLSLELASPKGEQVRTDTHNRPSFIRAAVGQPVRSLARPPFVRPSAHPRFLHSTRKPIFMSFRLNSDPPPETAVSKDGWMDGWMDAIHRRHFPNGESCRHNSVLETITAKIGSEAKQQVTRTGTQNQNEVWKWNRFTNLTLIQSANKS